MATLTEANSWEAGIYQLELTDPVVGGADGLSNLQAKQLANRTLYLKNLVDALGTGKQPLDATLTALAGVVTAANHLIYATGADTFATTSLSAFIRTLLDDDDAATARTTLGAAPLASPGLTGTPTAPTAALGTNTTQVATMAALQAAIANLLDSAPGALDTLNELAAALGDDPNFAATMTNALAGKQPLDATLTALAGVVTTANQLIYATGADTFATTSLSAFIRTLLDDADAATARTTLGAAPLASPGLTGTPTAPTAASGTNNTQVASTAFVQEATAAVHVAGAVLPFAMNAAPAGWLKANGAAVSRTTYSALFAALVTNAGFTVQTFTATLATPGVFTKVAHGFQHGARVRLATTGALPTGLNTTTDYFVEVINADTFYLSLTLMGARIATSGAQSGIHTYLQSWFGLGDGVTTFNLPDLRGEFLRGWDDGRGVDVGRQFGTSQLDAFQGHWHNLHGTPGQGSNVGGADQVRGGSLLSASAVQTPISDGTNGTPRIAAETRPRNVAVLVCIKY